MSSIVQLSARQKELLREVWIKGHHALTKKRQPFTHDIGCEDMSEWDGLISKGYLEPIPTLDKRFILTSLTDGIYDELMKPFQNKQIY